MSSAPDPSKKGTPLNLLWRHRPKDRPCICLGEAAVGETDRTFCETVHNFLSTHGPFRASIADSTIGLKVKGIGTDYVECEVEKDGPLIEGKGITLHGVPLDLPSFQTKDQQSLDFLIDQGYDWAENPTNPGSYGSFLAFVGVSFVKDRHDIIKVKRYAYDRILNILRNCYPDEAREKLHKLATLLSPSIIAKIETPQAWDNIDEILDVAA